MINVSTPLQIDFNTLVLQVSTYLFIMGQTKADFDFRDVELSNFMRALALPVRVAIIRILLPAKDKVAIDQILAQIPLMPDVIKKHLNALKVAGLIIRQSEGNVNYYKINDQKFSFCFANLHLFSLVKDLDNFK